MATAQAHVKLARSLPQRLQRFFALNPPKSPSSSEPPLPDQTAPSINGKLNPFMPHKHPKTGRWHPPIYSLRRQAELVKLAKQNGVEELLPNSAKSTQEREQRRLEHSGRLQEMGGNVKGHIWERTLKGRLDKRRQAMLKMPQLVQEWKQVSTLALRYI